MYFKWIWIGVVIMRKDGRRVKGVNPMYSVVPHIMKDRNDALNYLTIMVPYKSMHDYINKKRIEKLRISHLSLFIAAYVRVLSEFPELNRFVVNKKVYAHNDIQIAMVVLKPGSDSDETMGKVSFELTDTIFDVNDKINKFIEDSRNADEENGMDKFVRLMKIPGVLSVGVSFLKWLDKHGWLPKSIIDNVSPFHTSLTISNLASIRAHSIFHHIYNFGTTSLFITMGTLEKKVEKVNGEFKEVKYIPLGIVMDERIASGLYYSRAFRRFVSILSNPEILETAPETIEYDLPFKEKGKFF